MRCVTRRKHEIHPRSNEEAPAGTVIESSAQSACTPQVDFHDPDFIWKGRNHDCVSSS
jgi:hypothetical protein